MEGLQSQKCLDQSEAVNLEDSSDAWENRWEGLGSSSVPGQHSQEARGPGSGVEVVEVKGKDRQSPMGPTLLRWD